MQHTKKLTPQRFDAITNGPEKLWGLRSIANALSTSEDTVRRMTRRDTSFPVRQRGGRWFATRTELNAWLARR
ncbi:MAG: DNA-binding protein [Pseudooceanicola sp.]|nr:DNA-binding protein [Pseudooceanicola sp.]